MKRTITLLLILAPLAIMAQETLQDTTFFVGGRKFTVRENEGKIRVRVFEEVSTGDTLENQRIFEGVYLDGQSTEQRYTLTVPFIKKKKERRRWHFEPHAAGLYTGFYSMADGMGFGNSDDVDLRSSKTWEWGLNLFEGSLNLSHNWAFTSALGFGYTSFRLDNNRAFQEIDGITHILPDPDGREYRKSRLRYYHLRLPISIEWQQWYGYKGPLFFSLGAEVEARLWSKSIAKVDGKKQTIDKDLNVRPLGLNILAQAGYGDWGFYCRYSTSSLFEKNKGPKLYPYSIGIFWHW